MAQFPTPSEIQTNYKTILRSIKPSLNVNDENSDFIIRGNAASGLISGLYGDQQKVNNDTWINSCRSEALDLFGEDYGLPRDPATAAISAGVSIPGTNGTVVAPGQLTFIYLPTQVLYTNITGGTVSGGVVLLELQALTTGQNGNIKFPDSLQVISPPSGVGQTASLSVDMSGGTDVESDDSYRSRLLLRVQSPPAGGNQADYPAFAFAADPSVRSATIRRFGRGLGTVDVYITTGTTDIDNAVTNGLSIVRIPSGGVIASVQAYYDAHAPLTDCPEVFAPTELSVNASVNVDLAAGLTLSSVPTDPVNNPLNLTVLQLIQREVGRVMYKLPVGGRLIPGISQGVVAAADIEEGLDFWLSSVIDPSTGFAIGKLPILADREVLPLNGSQQNLPVISNQLPKPGTITVSLGV